MVEAVLYHVLAAGAALLGFVLLLFGQRLKTPVTLCSALAAACQITYAAYVRGGVNFEKYPAAHVLVAGIGIVVAFIAHDFPRVGRLVCGGCLGLLCWILVGQGVALLPFHHDIPSWAGYTVAAFVACITMCSEFLAYNVYTSFLGGLLLVLAAGHMLDQQLELKHFTTTTLQLKPRLLCDTMTCWGLFATWPILSLCGILFQAVTRDRLMMPALLTSSGGGYEAIPTCDEETGPSVSERLCATFTPCAHCGQTYVCAPQCPGKHGKKARIPCHASHAWKHGGKKPLAT